MLSAIEFYGFRIAGVTGAFLAPLATVGPGAALCSALGTRWTTLDSRPWITWIRRGLVPVGVGLMAAGVLVLARTSVRGVGEVLVSLVVPVAVQRKIVSSIGEVALAGAAGLLLQL
jgi:chromate transporter